MNILSKCVFLLALGVAAVAWGEEQASIRAKWEMPPKCDPFAPVRIEDLKEELRATGYRLVIALHPERPANSKGEYPARDLYLVNAAGTGLKQITDTPDKEEHIPRTSPDGKRFTYNYGDYLVDVDTLETRPIWGGYAWTPDSRQTASCKKGRIVYTDMQTGGRTRGARTERNVGIADMSFDGQWFIFEIRDFLGSKYSVDFMSVSGGEIRKMPNHPLGGGECHPGFSPDGKWMCWNSGGSLSVRRFDPTLPDGTDGKIITLPKERIGQDPCGRWSHCGRYIAYVKIPHAGSWRVHSPISIVRLADFETITISPPEWQGHHWDYDWLPPEDE
ncbi:MAG: PD40 domain-containing protein [Planctomycetes bacterium]|nr:PD40 domain-containing protein [Planctomycetota bacterium]